MITIDRASCLCLDKRWPERKDDILHLGKYLIEKHGTAFRVFMAGGEECTDLWYDHVDDPDPDVSNWGYGIPERKHHHYNAFSCHMKMIQEAKDAGATNLLMLEDDAYLTDRFDAVWNKIKDVPEIQDYDLLYLGWWVGDENDSWNRQAEREWQISGGAGVHRPNQVGGLHGCLVHRRMFDTLLSLPQNNPIDFQLNIRGGHDHLNSWIVTPKLIHTRTTYSYCEGSVIKRNEL